jgi:hypothetical protein
MSHTFQVSDEQYNDIVAYAEELGETSENLFQAWIEGITDWMEVQRIVRRKREKQDDEEEYDEEHPLLQLARRISAGEVAQTNGQANQKEREEQEEGPLDLLQIAGMFSIGEPSWIDRHDKIFSGEKVL